MIKTKNEIKSSEKNVNTVYFFSKKNNKIPAELNSVEELIHEAIKKDKSDVFSLYCNKTRSIAVVYSVGKNTDDENNLEDIRILGSRVCKTANALLIKNLILNKPTSVFLKNQALAFIEGLDLTNYEIGRAHV